MKRDLMRDLKVIMRVSFCWPQPVPARAFRRLIRGEAREMIDEMWGENVKWVSNTTPKIRGRRSRGSGVFLRVMCG